MRKISIDGILNCKIAKCRVEYADFPIHYEPEKGPYIKLIYHKKVLEMPLFPGDIIDITDLKGDLTSWEFCPPDGYKPFGKEVSEWAV